MADITDATATSFANEKIRAGANTYVQMYYNACVIIDEWNARGGTAMIPDTSDEIIDGAANDSRPVLTGSKCVNVMTQLITLKTLVEANDNAILNVLLAAANPSITPTV